jgi:hypothetical protein
MHSSESREKKIKKKKKIGAGNLAYIFIWNTGIASCNKYTSSQPDPSNAVDQRYFSS